MIVPIITIRQLRRLVLELNLRLGFHRRAWHFWNAETFRVPLVNCVRLLLRRRRWPHELFDHGCLLSDFPDLRVPRRGPIIFIHIVLAYVLDGLVCIRIVHTDVYFRHA